MLSVGASLCLCRSSVEHVDAEMLASECVQSMLSLQATALVAGLQVSDSLKHHAGPAAGAQGAAPKPSTTGKASAGGDTFENAFS